MENDPKPEYNINLRNAEKPYVRMPDKERLTVANVFGEKFSKDVTMKLPEKVDSVDESSEKTMDDRRERALTQGDQLLHNKKRGLLPKETLQLPNEVPELLIKTAAADGKESVVSIRKNKSVVTDVSGKHYIVKRIEQRVFEKRLVLEHGKLSVSARVESQQYDPKTKKILIEVTFLDSGKRASLYVDIPENKNDTMEQSNSMNPEKTSTPEKSGELPFKVGDRIWQETRDGMRTLQITNIDTANNEIFYDVEEQLAEGKPLKVQRAQHEPLKGFLRLHAKDRVQKIYSDEEATKVLLAKKATDDANEAARNARLDAKKHTSLADTAVPTTNTIDKSPQGQEKSYLGELDRIAAKKWDGKTLSKDEQEFYGYNKDQIGTINLKRRIKEIVENDEKPAEDDLRNFAYFMSLGLEKSIYDIQFYENHSKELEKYLHEKKSGEAALEVSEKFKKSAPENKPIAAEKTTGPESIEKGSDTEQQLAFLKREIEKYEKMSDSVIGKASALVALRGAQEQILKKYQEEQQAKLAYGIEERGAAWRTLNTRLLEISNKKITGYKEQLETQESELDALKKTLDEAIKFNEKVLWEAKEPGVSRQKQDRLALASIQQKEMIKDLEDRIIVTNSKIASTKSELELEEARYLKLENELAAFAPKKEEATATSVTPESIEVRTLDAAGNAVIANGPSVAAQKDAVVAQAPIAEVTLNKAMNVTAGQAEELHKLAELHHTSLANTEVPHGGIRAESAEVQITPEQQLEDARTAYAAAYTKFMDERRKLNGSKGMLNKIARVFRRDKIAYSDVPEYGDQLRDAEEAYSKAKEGMASHMLNQKDGEIGQTLRAHIESGNQTAIAAAGNETRGAQSAHRGEIFKKLIVGEQEKIGAMKLESLPTKKRNLVVKLLDRYSKLPPAGKIAVSAIIAATFAGAGAIAAGAGAVTLGGVAFSGAKLGALRSTIGTGAGMGVRGLFQLKDKITGNSIASRKEAKAAGLEKEYMLGAYDGKWRELEARYADIIAKEQRENRKRALVRGIVVAGASFSAARWGTQAIEGMTGWHPGAASPDAQPKTVTPEPAPRIVPPVETGPVIKPAFVEFTHGDGVIKGFEHLQQNLKIQYAGVPESQWPLTVKEIIHGDPTKLSIDYQGYAPGSDAESFMVREGAHMGIDDKGRLIFQNGGETELHYLRGPELGQHGAFNGQMFDSDHSGTAQNITPAQSPEELAKQLNSVGVHTTTIDTTGAPHVNTPEELARQLGLKGTPVDLHQSAADINQYSNTMGTETHAASPSGTETAAQSTGVRTPEVINQQAAQSFDKILTKDFGTNGSTSPDWLRIKNMDSKLALQTYDNMNAPVGSPQAVVVEPKFKTFLTDLKTLHDQSGLEPSNGEKLADYMGRAVEAVAKKGV